MDTPNLLPSSIHRMGPVRIRLVSVPTDHFATRSSHLVDTAGWQTKMASIETRIPLGGNFWILCELCQLFAQVPCLNLTTCTFSAKTVLAKSLPILKQIYTFTSIMCCCNNVVTTWCAWMCVYVFAWWWSCMSQQDPLLKQSLPTFNTWPFRPYLQLVSPRWHVATLRNKCCQNNVFRGARSDLNLMSFKSLPVQVAFQHTEKSWGFCSQADVFIQNYWAASSITDEDSAH